MKKLTITCEDSTLLAHLMRGLLVDLNTMHMKATSPTKRRAIESAIKTAKIEGRA